MRRGSCRKWGRFVATDRQEAQLIASWTCRTPRRPTPGQRAWPMPSPAATALGPGIEMLPASVYIDPDRYEAEQRKIFDKVPHLLAPSALLRDAAGGRT